MPGAVVDTNVLVSGLLNPDGAPGRVVDLILAGELQVIFDDRILREYRVVLNRPGFGFRPQDVDDLMDYVREEGWGITAPPLAISLPDPKDAPFLEVAAASRSPVITGNKRHFPEEAERAAGLQVLTPGEFLEAWLKK